MFLVHFKRLPLFLALLFRLLEFCAQCCCLLSHCTVWNEKKTLIRKIASYISKIQPSFTFLLQQHKEYKVKWGLNYLYFREQNIKIIGIVEKKKYANKTIQ